MGSLKGKSLANRHINTTLINNAANNPKMESASGLQFSRVENFPLDIWEADLAVGLTGAFLCSKVFGAEMARRGHGVIVNVASDLALISPDQRLYRQDPPLLLAERDMRVITDAGRAWLERHPVPA